MAARLRSYTLDSEPALNGRRSPASSFLSMFSRSSRSPAQSRPRTNSSLSFQSIRSTDDVDNDVLGEYMATQFVPETSESRIATHSRDPHYTRTIEHPRYFVDMLMKAANLDKINNASGERILPDALIRRIKNMMVPELVINAVQKRDASYLLGLAQSPCTSEWVKTTERTINGYNQVLEDPSSSDDDRAQALRSSASFCLNIATILLDGIDIGNWDNFSWAIPADLIPQRKLTAGETPAVKYIRDRNLRPTNVKHTPTARGRFGTCGLYFQEHKAAFRKPVQAKPVENSTNLPDEYGTMPVSVPRKSNENAPDEWGQVAARVQVPVRAQVPARGGTKTRRSKHRKASTRRQRR
jgi:hypothetical protein